MSSKGLKISIGIQGFITFYIQPDANYTASELRDMLIDAIKKQDENFMRNNIENLYIKPEISYVNSSEGNDRYELIEDVVKRLTDSE